MTSIVFFVLLGAGIAVLLAGLVLTRQSWRPEIPPFGRHLRYAEIALHPERYATGRYLPAIRALNVAGALLLCAALGVVIRDIVQTTGRG